MQSHAPSRSSDVPRRTYAPGDVSPSISVHESLAAGPSVYGVGELSPCCGSLPCFLNGKTETVPDFCGGFPVAVEVALVSLREPPRSPWKKKSVRLSKIDWMQEGCAFQSAGTVMSGATLSQIYKNGPGVSSGYQPLIDRHSATSSHNPTRFSSAVCRVRLQRRHRSRGNRRDERADQIDRSVSTSRIPSDNLHR